VGGCSGYNGQGALVVGKGIEKMAIVCKQGIYRIAGRCRAGTVRWQMIRQEAAFVNVEDGPCFVGFVIPGFKRGLCRCLE
jgi:hypothetical protein